MMKKSDIIEIASLAAILILLACLNYALKLPAAPLFFSGMGIFFYSMLVYINAVHSNASCDYVQTGEAAIGIIAIYACSRYFTENPYLILLAEFISLLLYNVYLEVLIAPEKNERVLNGILIQAAPAVIFLYLSRVGQTLQPEALEKIFFGFFGSAQYGYTGVAASIVLGFAVLSLSLAFYPELKLFSQGEFFFAGTKWAVNAINIGIMLMRSLLAAATIAFLGMIGGFGLYARKLSRNRFPGLVTAMKLYIFAEAAIILSSYTSPWYAIAVSVCISYAAFMFYAKKTVCLYDRT
jgi:hypothetical protein